MSTTSRSVLVLDKEPALLELMTYFLDTQGFSVFTATSPAQTLAICAERHPTVALLELDLLLPRNLKFLAEVRAASPGTKVCVMSASGATVSADRLLALGVGHYFAKPFTLHQLIATLDRMSTPTG